MQLARSITLRPENAGDEGFSLSIYASTRGREMEMVPWSDEQKQTFLRMQFEAQRSHYLMHMPDATYSVVEVDGDAVGRLYVDRRKDEIRIVDIALLPEARGRGIGSVLLRSILDEAHERNVTVTLHVEPDNPARAWYERFGFEVVEQAGAYLLMARRPPS